MVTIITIILAIMVVGAVSYYQAVKLYVYEKVFLYDTKWFPLYALAHLPLLYIFAVVLGLPFLWWFPREGIEALSIVVQLCLLVQIILTHVVWARCPTEWACGIHIYQAFQYPEIEDRLMDQLRKIWDDKSYYLYWPNMPILTFFVNRIKGGQFTILDLTPYDDPARVRRGFW